MTTNTAAWLNASKAGSLEVKSAPYTSPQQGEIVIKNHAVAINPVDWILRDQGNLGFGWLKFPFILGTDVAEEVIEVGSSVTRFKVGNRVLGQAVGQDKEQNTSAKGGFQTYAVLLADVASHVPSTLSYESAAVLPLGVSTAACGLFQKDHLGLQLPTIPRAKSTGKTLLIWGGSTSVGSNAIQLAVAAGYEVITTASPRNFDFVKRLGASQAFDYNSKSMVSDLIQAFRGKTTAGALTIGHGAAEACMDILHECQGDKFISMVSYSMPNPPPKNLIVPRTIFSFVSFMTTNFIKSKTRGIGTNFVFGTTLIHNEVGKAVYVDFLEEALAQGTYIAAPDAKVVGEGLVSLQGALNLQKKGVSASKLVVSL